MHLSSLSARRPWHVGLLVYLVLVLTSSLLSAPWVAAGLDFGHWHPDDTPPHIHRISGVLAGAVTATVIAVNVSFRPVMSVAVRPLPAHLETTLDPALPIRAPPAAA